MHLRSRVIAAEPIDRRLWIWLGFLAALAAVNAGFWIWIARSVTLRTPYAETQFVLSGIYVAVCGFRSLFPRVDLERVCLWDTWLSAILLGRTVATIAELCFALQCALFVEQLSAITGSRVLATVADSFVPLVVVAEVACWYAVLSLNHLGHAIEESLWALLMLMLAAACATAAFAVHESLRGLLVAGFLVYAVGGSVTLAFDVRMYIRRWRRRTSDFLPLASGWHDTRHRRHPTFAWTVWREEVPWMTLYFSFGVWTSLAMVLFSAM